VLGSVESLNISSAYTQQHSNSILLMKTMLFWSQYNAICFRIQYICQIWNCSIVLFL